MEGQAETCPSCELPSGSLFIVLMFVISDRPQEVREGPLGYASALLPRLLVREAEVDALIDADVDHVSSRIRESGIGARLLNGRWVISGHQEGHLVRPEEVGKHTGYGTGDVVGARAVVGIVRSIY